MTLTWPSSTYCHSSDVGMPMQLAQAARFELEHHAGHRRRDRKAAGIDAPFAAALVDRSGAARRACGTCAYCGGDLRPCRFGGGSAEGIAPLAK